MDGLICDANGGGHLVRRDLLEEIPGRARLDGVVEIGFLVADRQHDDLGAGGDLLDGGACLDPAPLGHPHIHQDDVGQQVGGLLDGLGAVARLPHDLDVLLGREHDLQAPAEQGVVVDHKDSDRFLAWRVRVRAHADDAVVGMLVTHRSEAVRHRSSP
jgi:hypothetical protein